MEQMMNPTFCLECRLHIPVDHECLYLRDKGCLHLDCVNKEHRVFKVELNGPGNPMIADTEAGALEEAKTLLLEGVKGDSVTITVDLMKAGDFHALPEHGGW